MSTLTTVPRGTTTFKHYTKPRYSKAKIYKVRECPKYLREICCICHKSLGEHYRHGLFDLAQCPEYQILNK